MGEKQRKIYDYFRNQYRIKLIESKTQGDMKNMSLHVLQGLTFLREICDSPNLIQHPFDYKEMPVKIELLLNYIPTQIKEHKILIFSQFVGMLNLIRKEFDAIGIDYLYLDGQTPMAKRRDQINLFQSDEKQRLFLISLKAGGVGLNLSAADYVYIVDPWWNPTVEQQAIDRTHRIGQTKKVFSYKIVCRNSIEEKILQLQQRKNKLATDLIIQNKSIIRNLSNEDIQFLFG